MTTANRLRDNGSRLTVTTTTSTLSADPVSTVAPSLTTPMTSAVLARPTRTAEPTARRELRTDVT